MTSPICWTANWLALETWQLLGFSYVRKRRGIDERGITDRNLLMLEARHPGQVWVSIFPQNHEALTGADFEWWIGDGSTYLPMLVQAKRLSRNGHYVGLTKRLPKSETRQITRLIEMCTTGRGVPGGMDYVGHLPAYLFYNTLTTAGVPPDRCCGYLKDAALRGCAIAHAVDVRRCLEAKPKRGSRSIKRIGRETQPWGCLFCCRQEERVDTAHFAKALLDRHDGGDGEKSHLSRVRALNELPRYIWPALDGGFGDEWVQDQTEQLPGAGVVIVTTVPRSKEREIDQLS